MRRRLRGSSLFLAWGIVDDLSDIVQVTVFAEQDETIIPADIWEEIAGLAQGREPERPKPVPVPEPAKVETRPARIPRAPVEQRAAEHRVHLSHHGYGTDPSSRPPSEQEGLDPLAARLDADAARARALLGQGRNALRQAVILQEVLGPPAAVRSDRFED